MQRRFELALAQMRVKGGDKGENLARAEERIGEAADHGSRMVVLPEAVDVGWTHPSSKTEAEPVPEGMPFRRLSRAAARTRLYVCAGLTERDGDQIFNSAVIIGPSGALLCRHRKINELDIAHDLYAHGDRLNVVRTELGTLGLMICADATAKDHVLSRALGYMGAEIILMPSSWAVPPEHDPEREPYGETWRQAYEPVAREFALWMVGVSNVGFIEAGPWAGWKCIGCSMVVNPEGQTVIQGPYGVDAETMLYVEITLVDRPARGTGWMAYWRERS